MCTVGQIKSAHSKVKSGADFPAYIKEIKQLGVTSYETFVSGGHTDYFGASNYKTTAPGKYIELIIAEKSNAEQFIANLKEHQQGKTDFPMFIRMRAEFGIEKWKVSMEKITCAYFDKSVTKFWSR